MPQERVLPNAPAQGLAVGMRRLSARLESMVSQRHLHIGGEVGPKLGKRVGPSAVNFAIRSLRMINLHESFPGRSGRVRPERCRAGSGRAELNITPLLGTVHIDRALWRPHPVVLGPIGQLSID